MAQPIYCTTVALRLNAEHVCCPSCVEDMNMGEPCLQYEYGEVSPHDPACAVITSVLEQDEWCEVCCELPRVLYARNATTDGEVSEHG